jgi:hypothetical protein
MTSSTARRKVAISDAARRRGRITAAGGASAPKTAE